MTRLGFVVLAVFCVAAGAVRAADYPAPREGDFIVRDFRFHAGEVLPELRLHYTTIGAPSGEPVLVLHGTAGSAASMLTPEFAGELFGAGQPLDASRYFIILPDGLGTGKSSKPSDGLRAKFPAYNYDDMVRAQYRLVTEHFGVKKLRAVVGNSMGGMQTWMWATMYPDALAAAVPLACMPTEVAGRNWMTRRMLIDLIRNDPEFNGGNYTRQPRGLQLALLYFQTAMNGGNLGLHKLAPTNAKADELWAARMAQPVRADANDVAYQFDASRGYNPWPDLERIQAAVLAINSADDERNPPEFGVMEQAMKRVKRGRYFLIPASEDTRGHGTTGQAKWWKRHLADLLHSGG
ncbi:MAG: alpha/beta fold hydrolase [Betaproteobacteria bacterium]|nr:alpha/beta fold hydrolase [Betaproteobacteria bacterium]